MNFIEEIVEKDLQEGVNDGRIQTRFPPEPNGYLHIGHVKAICMDFGIAEKYNGVCNLRFDDTNPVKEDTEYVDSITNDIKWLGFKWGEIFYASDYFEQLYELAIRMIKAGKAYVDEQTAEEIAARMNAAIPVADETTPAFKNITIEDIICKGAKRAIYFNGLPEQKIENVTLKNINMTAVEGAIFNQTKGLTINELHIICTKGESLKLNSTVENVSITNK